MTMTKLLIEIYPYIAKRIQSEVPGIDEVQAEAILLVFRNICQDEEK